MYLRHCRRCNHLFFFSLITRLLSFSLIPQKGFQNESHMINRPKQHSNKDRQSSEIPSLGLGKPLPRSHMLRPHNQKHMCALLKTYLARTVCTLVLPPPTHCSSSVRKNKFGPSVRKSPQSSCVGKIWREIAATRFIGIIRAHARSQLHAFDVASQCPVICAQESGSCSKETFVSPASPRVEQYFPFSVCVCFSPLRR